MKTDPLNPTVLDLLGKATGLYDKEAWTNIWTLVSKAEHNNDDPTKAFLTDEGKSLFGYASALSYDQSKRGVTLGAIGWTSGDGGKDGHGDAPELFKMYKKLGGEDLMPYVDGCCSSKEKCKKLIDKIHSIQDDPKWIQAQFQNLVTGEGYIAQAMRAWNKAGVEKPSALAIGVAFDTLLNMGDPPAAKHLVKLATKGDEPKTLKDYCKWKTSESGKNEYNDPPINGKNRGQMWADLVDAKCFSLKNCDSQMRKAMAWKMK